MRQGLSSWVEGLIEGVARLLHGFSNPVVLKLLRGRDDGTCDHEVIQIGQLAPPWTSWISAPESLYDILPPAGPGVVGIISR